MVKLGSGSVVVGTNDNQSAINSYTSKIKKHKYIVLVVGILIITGLLFLVISESKNTKVQNQQQSSTKYKAPVSTAATVLNEQQISNLISQRKFSEAETALVAQVAQTKAEADFISLANVQMSEYKYTAAIQTLQSAEKLYGPDYSLSQGLASIEVIQSKNTQAVTYYQQAIASLQKYPGQVNNPSSVISNTNAIIVSLQKVKK